MTPALAKGYWIREKQADGSHWVLGPDPKDGCMVLVAACETEQDAEHIVNLHNKHAAEPEHRELSNLAYGIQGVAGNLEALKARFEKLKE